MGLTEWFSIVQFIAIIAVGLVLHQKIKAQSELMEQYKKYIDILDINKIEQATKFREDATIGMIKAWAENDGREFLASELDRKFDEFDGETQTNYDEMANAILSILLASPPAERKLLLDLLPNSASMFLDELEEEEKRNPFLARRNRT